MWNMITVTRLSLFLTAIFPGKLELAGYIEANVDISGVTTAAIR